MSNRSIVSLVILFLIGMNASAQVLTLKEAVETALHNYGSIKAKASYLKSSQATVKQTTAEYFPDFSIGAQQAWGNANGTFGPLYASRGLSAGSSGPVFPTQSWNAAFGALYVANVNWDFFQFGRMKERTKVAEAEVAQQASDLQQEKFQQQVRVAGAYLNLLAAQRLRMSQQRNLERAMALRNVVVARAKNGLNPGVDSSQANAEVSSAKISLTNAVDYELGQANQLSELMGIPGQQFLLDTFFVNRIPNAYNLSSEMKEDTHPILKFYQSRINVSREQEKYFDRAKYPVFTLFGVIQSRGSGFNYDYGSTNQDAFTHNYWSGVQPSRSNYLLGVGVTWNMTSILRVRQQVIAQQWTSEGLKNEYELADQQIKSQLALADQKMQTAIANYTEAPVQVKAASDAYLQKSVLYKNGLATIVDITQALYILNRAETDRDISVNNVWQALLMKAAASGDFNLFINEF
jgi:outer membrane protein TolC